MCEFHVPERRQAGARATTGRRSAWAALFASLMLSAGVASGAARAGELLVGAAVSLREPLTRIAVEFEARSGAARVLLSFGASSTLAAQARAGAPLDVFVAADPRLVDGLAQEGWLEARRDVARGRLVVVAAAGVALERPEDLAAARIRRIAIPAAAVPLGGYARDWLARRGLLARLEGRIVETEHARATLAAVDAGHVDAAIVYATDAQAGADRRSWLEIPSDEQPAILYSAALRAGAGPEAREFFEFLHAPAARAHLAAAGFAAP